MLCKKRSEPAFAPAEICKTTNSCPRERFCVLPTFFFKIRPSDLTSRNWHDILIAVDGALAQLVAHNTGSVGVRSSNLLCSTKPKKSELDPSWGWVRISSFYLKYCGVIESNDENISVQGGYKQDKIEMRGDRAEMSDFPLYLNTVAGGLDCRDQTIGGFSFVVKIYAVPVVEILGCLKMSAFSLLHNVQPAILHLIDHIAGPRDVLRAVAGQQDGLVLRLEALEQVMHLLHGCLVHRVERLI